MTAGANYHKLSGLLRNLYAGQEATDLDVEQQTGSKLEKEYLTYMQSTSCKMPGWMKHKLESRLLGEISVISDMQMIPPYGRKQRGSKESFDDSERSEKVGLKLNIQKPKIMASGPITLWQIDRETVETVADFIFLGSKITADGDCSHEIKRCLILGRKL